MSDDGYVETVVRLTADGAVEARITTGQKGQEKTKFRPIKHGAPVGSVLRSRLDAAPVGTEVDARVTRKSGETTSVFVPDEEPPERRRTKPEPTAVPDLGPTKDQAEALRERGGVNPYTFVPAPPRAGLRTSPFGDAEPTSHAWAGDRHAWTGTIVVAATTRTPMLLPDPQHRRETDGHHSYPLRVDEQGRPQLHGASVKGALRSAYETVTGSRFGVFRGHGKRLAYRQAAGAGSGLQKKVPKGGDLPDGLYAARVVEKGGDGNLAFLLCDVVGVPRFTGRPTEKKNKGTGRVEPWEPPPLAVIDEEGVARCPTDVEWQDLHGEHVHARVARNAVASFQRGAPVGLRPEEKKHWRQGWLRVTGRTIESKVDEQLFVRSSRDLLPVEDAHHETWRLLVDSYNEAARTGGPMPLSGGDGDLERSHVVTKEAAQAGVSGLRLGDLVYVEVADTKVVGVQPSPLSRRLHEATPEYLASAAGLTPATSLDQLSAADRLFGWVPAQHEEGERPSSVGYRGRLRVSEVAVDGEGGPEAWRRAGGTLAPLSSPKPSQFRFYAARDAKGTPPAMGSAKSEGFRTGGGLRGRKHYWWPTDVGEGYWTAGTGRVSGRHREWQALADEHADVPDGTGHKLTQTVTHDHWVKAGVTFVVTLALDAVPVDDLAPLIWLLEQPGSVLRLGGGKPHGFGAVDVRIDPERSRLWDGAAQRERWLALRPPEAPPLDVKPFVDRFEAALDREPVMRDVADTWRTVVTGTDRPIHYPRTTEQPQAEGYTWFVKNDHVESGKGVVDGGPVYGFALPHAGDENQQIPRLSDETTGAGRRTS